MDSMALGVPRLFAAFDADGIVGGIRSFEHL
jgi:hypothetical protein